MMVEIQMMLRPRDASNQCAATDFLYGGLGICCRIGEMFVVEHIINIESHGADFQTTEVCSIEILFFIFVEETVGMAYFEIVSCTSVEEVGSHFIPVEIKEVFRLFI